MTIHLNTVPAKALKKAYKSNRLEFSDYFQRFQQPNQKSFLVCDHSGDIAGVFIYFLLHCLFFLAD
jgi:hypothetical protein